jgi:hypothetical protein
MSKESGIIVEDIKEEIDETNFRVIRQAVFLSKPEMV